MKAEAKKYYSQLTGQSQPRLTFPLLTGHLHICVSSPIFAFCVADPEFQPPLAYQMLEKVIKAFKHEYAEAVQAAEREYVFMEFDSTLDAIRNEYHSRVAATTLNAVQSELEGVKADMSANIKAALLREEKLEQVGNLSAALGENAGAFAKESNDLNRLYLWRTYGRPAVVLGIVSVVYFLVSLVVI
jgi:hypothetical protein